MTHTDNQSKNSQIESIEFMQTQKLQDLLNYVNLNSTYYKKLFASNNIAISEIKTLNDLKKIPVTTKDDLYTNNKDFICVSADKIIDYVTTSGTLGSFLYFHYFL